MSTRALRKLHGGNDLSDLVLPDPIESLSQEDEDGSDKDSCHEHVNGNISDEKSATHPAKSKMKKKQRAKKHNIASNPFDLLNEDSVQDEAEVAEDMSQTDPEKNCEVFKENSDVQLQGAGGRKKKKKKKKKKNPEIKDNTSQLRESEDEIEASIREVNQLLGEIPTRFSSCDHGDGGPSGVPADFKALLTIEHKNLNPDNEMRRIFGSNVVQADQNRQANRRHRPRVARKSTWLVQAKNNWPPLGKTGLSMSLVETTPHGQHFVFEHNKEYQKVQFQFLEAVESIDPQNIINMVNAHPHHIDTLLQVSEICKMSDDMQMAGDFIERTLFTFEYAFHPMFSLTQGNSRLDYRQQENRAFYIALFRHLNFIGKRGCYRTSLEFCKFLLSLDPEGDPLCVLLMIDFYALRSSQYKFLIQMYQEWEAHRNLSQLPNFAFSVPLAMFHAAQEEGSSLDNADEMLQQALIMFPGLLIPLLDKCNIVPDVQVSSHSFFGPMSQYEVPKALEQLSALYIGRTSSCWKEPGVVAWLENNVKQVLSRVDRKEPLIDEYQIKRKSRYQGTPRNIHRHIIMSEVKEATAALPPDLANAPVMSYDPLPPTDSRVAYTRPERLRRAQQSSSPLSMFFQSLLPNFNPQEIQEVAQGAVGGEGQNFRQGVVQVMDAMRDLLNNIRPVPAPVENEGNEENDAANDVPDQEWD